MPHMNKKPLERKRTFVHTPFSHSTLKLEWKISQCENTRVFVSLPVSAWPKSLLQIDFKKHENVWTDLKKHSRTSPDVNFKEFSLTKQKNLTYNGLWVNKENQFLKKKVRSKSEKKKQKINVKMPHVNKTTSEKWKFISNKKQSLEWSVNGLKKNHLEKNPIQKIEKTVKIRVKLPHVNKKPLPRNQIFVQTPFSHSTLKLECKISGSKTTCFFAPFPVSTWPKSLL